jgi:putative tryptophan/tyrosine transport system substrate-binding protein
MKRREFITLLGSATTLPFAATAQQQANMPVIGWLNGAGPPQPARVEAVRHGLGELGYVEGRNVLIENHWTVGNYDRMREMAAELARRPHAALIVTGGGAPANKIVTTIPVVFATGADPVKAGMVANLNRPGAMRPACTFSRLRLRPSASVYCVTSCRPPSRSGSY